VFFRDGVYLTGSKKMYQQCIKTNLSDKKKESTQRKGLKISIWMIRLKKIDTEKGLKSSIPIQ